MRSLKEHRQHETPGEDRAGEARAGRGATSSRPGPDTIVVLVDDDVEICLALQEWLHLSGIRTACFLSAEALLADLLAEDGELWLFEPDGSRHLLGAAVVDLNLPGMHGLALASLLRRDAPGLRLVIITAAHEDECEPGTSRPEGLVWLGKPIKLDQLEKVLTAA